MSVAGHGDAGHGDQSSDQMADSEDTVSKSFLEDLARLDRGRVIGFLVHGL